MLAPKNLSIPLALIVAAGLGGSAIAQSPPADRAKQATAQSSGTASSTSTQGAAEEDEDKMRCKRIRKTGTRVNEKICRTERQWAAIEEAARESGSIMQSAGAVNTTPPPTGG
jgi:hypothetical protein